MTHRDEWQKLNIVSEILLKIIYRVANDTN